MLEEFKRVVLGARPSWWLLENVPGVPDVQLEGYSWLRLDLDPRDFGARQSRLRHFQFGHVRGKVPIVTRRARRGVDESQRCCMASEASRPGRRAWADFCELQGLPRDFELPWFTRAARYRAVGNGVHVLVARAVAAAIVAAVEPGSMRLCACNCGRMVEGRHVLATPACRKRAQRRRDAAADDEPGSVTVTARGTAAPAPSPQRVTGEACSHGAASQ